MDCYRYTHVFLAIALCILTGAVRSDQSLLKTTAGGRKALRPRTDSSAYCESWKFTVENNDAGKWSTVPSRCEEYVKNYMNGDRYLSDSAFVADDSITFAKNVTLAAGDGKDCWVFDIDETLLSNLPYYAEHRYGAEAYNETLFDEWTEKGVAPALPESLRLYKELQRLKFTIFLLTGRSEIYRHATVKNLHLAGYENWSRLILRGESDEGKKAVVYKSSKREQLEKEGYRIHGNSGDQWSDLFGNATAIRSFKLPNPMYYIA